MPTFTQKTYVPTHRDFIVEFAPGEFRSSLKSLKAFEAGQTLAVLEGLTKGAKAYSTVQCGRGEADHIELNSDLVYINHSCEPNTAFDLSSSDRSKWHLRSLKAIKPGEDVTFFYPSTEWEMDQPFNCACGTQTCLGTIQGARFFLKETLLERGWVNPWILELVEERDSKSRQKDMARL